MICSCTQVALNASGKWKLARSAPKLTGPVQPPRDGFSRLQNLRLWLEIYALCHLTGLDQGGECQGPLGLAVEIGGIEDRPRPVAEPAAHSNFTANAWLLAAVQLGEDAQAEQDRIGAAVSMARAQVHEAATISSI